MRGGAASVMYVSVRQTWHLASRSRARADDGARAAGSEPPPDNRSAQELQEARLAAGVCLFDLSEQTGLDVAKLASWERGEDQPDGCVRAALLDVLRERRGGANTS